MDSLRPSWTSRYSFILASIGSAVGLGNIWRFPYIMGKYGGAVFLIVYLFLILTICFIPLLAELATGKILKKECIGAYESVNPKFKPLGFLNPLTGVLISSFYFVVGGWIINYIYISFVSYKTSDFSGYFSSFIQGSTLPVIFTLLFFVYVYVFYFQRNKKRHRICK